MLTGLDHLVILVEELEDAVAGYESWDFRVTPGGEHADGLTATSSSRSSTAPTSSSLLHRPRRRAGNVWGWRQFLRTAAASGLLRGIRRPSGRRRRLVEEGFGWMVRQGGECSRRDADTVEAPVSVRRAGCCRSLSRTKPPGACASPAVVYEASQRRYGISRLLISARIGRSREPRHTRGQPGDARKCIPPWAHELAIVTPTVRKTPERSFEPSGPGPSPSRSPPTPSGEGNWIRSTCGGDIPRIGRNLSPPTRWNLSRRTPA